MKNVVTVGEIPPIWGKSVPKCFQIIATVMKKNRRRNEELIAKISLKIKLRREQLGLTQAQLDKLTGLRVYKYETGELEPSVTTLAILSKVLKMNGGEFFPEE